MYLSQKNRRNCKGLRSSLFYVWGIVMIEQHCCFIREQFFSDNPNFKNMLDPGNTLKQSKRTHICIEIKIGKNNVYVPLRNNLGEPLRKFGKIGFSVPSLKRPRAGLDYRYSLIINNSAYIEKHQEPKLPNSQYQIIKDNYNVIEREITEYITKYIKAANKSRHTKEPLFKLSSLINFHRELGIISSNSQKDSFPEVAATSETSLISEAQSNTTE